MHVYVLKSEQIVDRPLDEVFEFFSRPENLEALTPRQLRFKILTPSPVPMHTGSLIDYEIRMSGFPMHWRTMISSFDPPRSFVDQQLIGPYAMWHHRHSFDEIDGRTRLRDEVHYALPLGVLGRLAHALYVRRELTKIFAYRRRVISDMFGSGTEASARPAAEAGVQRSAPC